jgi:hypothetical protein
VVRVHHDPIRWDQIGEGPQAGEEPIPLEPWLQDRIDAHTDLVRQRAVRGERWLLGALHAWDLRNTHELLTEVAPELVVSHRGDPPGHLPGQEAAYYDRQLRWLEQTLASLRGKGGQLAVRLAASYQEGEQLRASLLCSFSWIPGDVIRGAASRRQVEREQWAREWDRRVSDLLPEAARLEWAACSPLPTGHPTRSLIEPTSNIAGVRGHLADRLTCLKDIIGRLEADAPLSQRAGPGALASEVVTHESIERELTAFIPLAGRMLQGQLTQGEVTDWGERVGISLRARGPQGEEEMFLAEGHNLEARAELQAKVARLQNHILPRVRSGEWTR